MNYIKSNEQFLSEVYNLVGNEYTFLEEYKGCKTKILVRHNRCRFEWEVTPNAFLSKGARCLKCNKKYRRTEEDFKKELKDLYGDEYILLSKYKNSVTRVLVKHKCGHEYYVYPLNLLKGKSHCPKCTAKRMASQFRLSYKKVKNYIEERGYVLLSKEYKNARTKLKIKCPEGHIFKMNFNNFQQGQRCPICANIKNGERCKKDIKEIEKIVKKYGFKIIKWVGEYKNRNSKFIIECPYGHQTETSVASFLNTKGCCSICNESKGERTIANFLLKNKIKFKKQYKFNDCKGLERPLPFDFAVLDKKGNIKCLIEYDGEQHYIPREFFGGKEYLRKRKYYDNIKNKYCKKNNLKLIRIPYFEFDNIEQILSNKII